MQLQGLLVVKTDAVVSSEGSTKPLGSPVDVAAVPAAVQ